jgi:hypothetical protein
MTVLALLGAALIAGQPGAVPAPCDGIRVAVAASPAGIRSLGGERAVLDIGAVSGATANVRRGHGFLAARVARSVAVRVDGCAGTPRFARLRASVAGNGGTEVRVDGVRLSSIPALVDAAAPLGASVHRTIEIAVPPSEPEGPLALAITWIADTD